MKSVVEAVAMGDNQEHPRELVVLLLVLMEHATKLQH